MDGNDENKVVEELENESQNVKLLADNRELHCKPSPFVENEAANMTASDFDLTRPMSDSTSTLMDSLRPSERDSLITMDGEVLTSSMMTSGVECFDSSDIEIIKEDRGSGDSIEIIETSTLTSAKLTDITLICDNSFQENDVNLPCLKELFTSQPRDACDIGTLKSNVGTLMPSGHDMSSRANTPLSTTSDSSYSGNAPDVSYSKLQESDPSSYSPSPFESPTHSMQSQSAPCENFDRTRPESLSLPKPKQLHERHKFTKKQSYSSLSEYSSHSGSMDALIEAATSTPLHAQGTVSVEGDMLTFVAHDINELIKKSRARSQSSSSVSSTTSGWSTSVPSHAPRSPSSVYTQSPDDVPPIDPKALLDVELHARKAAETLDVLMQTLVARLHLMSLSVHNCLDVYKEAVDKTCDAVDANIKSMYALMAKCEELGSAVRPVYQIQDQIKEIKRLLDLFESQLSEGE